MGSQGPQGLMCGLRKKHALTYILVTTTCLAGAVVLYLLIRSQSNSSHSNNSSREAFVVDNSTKKNKRTRRRPRNFDDGSLPRVTHFRSESDRSRLMLRGTRRFNELRRTARDVAHLSDNIAMADALNSTGQEIMSANASTQCDVPVRSRSSRSKMVTVSGFERNVSLDSSMTSCKVSRFLLKPITWRLTGDNAQDTQLLEQALLRGPAVRTRCDDQSTFCTVHFDRGLSSSRSLREYNKMLSTSFGIAAPDVASVTATGISYVMVPNGRNGSIPRRAYVRVESDQSRSVMVYKYSAVSLESPQDLWQSAGRNSDNDIAMNPDSPSMTYASELLSEGAWSAFQFSYIVVEARRGSAIIAQLRFRATEDRQGWFHPKFLVAAKFGTREMPATFSNRAFARFQLAPPPSASSSSGSTSESNEPRLYFCVMDEAEDASRCATQKFFMCIPYKATSCASYDYLNAKVVATQEERPVTLGDYDLRSGPTHVAVFLVMSSSSVPKSDELGGPLGSGSGSARVKGVLEQKKPQNPLKQGPLRPSRQAPVIVLSSCSADPPAWQLAMPAEGGAYPETRMTALLESQAKTSMQASLLSGGASQGVSLSGLERVRFLKTTRVVVFGQGRSLSPDATFVLVLQDWRVATAADRPPTSSFSMRNPQNLRYADGRTDSVALDEKSHDNDGSFLDACLAGSPAEGLVQSMIVEKVSDELPVLAARQCQSSRWDVQLHVGHYRGGARNQDVTGNPFDPKELRSFKVAAGYTLQLFTGEDFTDVAQQNAAAKSAQQNKNADSKKGGQPSRVVRGPTPQPVCITGTAMKSFRVLHNSTA